MWDIRNNKCLQTLVDRHVYRPEDNLTCLMYDPKRRWLLSGANLLKARAADCQHHAALTSTPKAAPHVQPNRLLLPSGATLTKVEASTESACQYQLHCQPYEQGCRQGLASIMSQAEHSRASAA